MNTAVSVIDLMYAPYADGGRWEYGAMPLGGIDCWGLVVEVRSRAGLWTPDPLHDQDPNGGKPLFVYPDGLFDAITTSLVSLDAPRDFCAVQIKSDWPGGHVGVYLPDKTVMHACPIRRGPCVRRQPLSRMRNRVLGLHEFQHDQTHE